MLRVVRGRNFRRVSRHRYHFAKGNAMRVLITGITGFAGSHLADLCLAKPNVELCGIIRWRSRTENIEHIWDRVKFLECDLRDATSTRDAIEEIRPEYIFHLAAQSFVPTSWNAPSESLITNIIGQLNVFEAVRKIKLDCRIQIACSSEEYGMVYPGEIPIKETNPLRPLSPYAVSKVGQDMLAYQYFMSYRTDVVRTRGFNHTGPRRPAVFVCSDFAKQIVDIERGQRDPIIRVGNLDARRDFTDVRDIVRGYWLALEKGKSGEVYNICSGKSHRIGDVLGMLIALAGVRVEVRQEASRMRPSDVPHLEGDYGKFRADTGWRPEIPFERTLKDLLDFWRSNPGRR
jgi:GDP-4-dehydro-6-deoxy-D-mannose reductase